MLCSNRHSWLQSALSVWSAPEDTSDSRKGLWPPSSAGQSFWSERAWSKAPHVLHMTKICHSFLKLISDIHCHFLRSFQSLAGEVWYTTGTYLKSRQNITFSFTWGHWDDINASVTDEPSMFFIFSPPKLSSYQDTCQRNKNPFIHNNSKLTLE